MPIAMAVVFSSIMLYLTRQSILAGDPVSATAAMTFAGNAAYAAVTFSDQRMLKRRVQKWVRHLGHLGLIWLVTAIGCLVAGAEVPGPGDAIVVALLCGIPSIVHARLAR